MIELLSNRAAAVLLTLVSVFAGAVNAAQADSLAEPQGRVVLSVTGDISHTNAEGRADFDVAMLKAMPAAVLETSTPWTDDVPVFKGVLARDLLEEVGARGERVNAVALNDYQFEIPVSDFEQYRVLLAYQMNGKQLRIRDKGPLWVVYPLDAHEALQSEETHSKMIWQLRRLVVE